MNQGITMEWEVSNGDTVEVWVEIEYSTHMNGIGAYEFWGYKGYDWGELEVDIEGISVVNVLDEYDNPYHLSEEEFNKFTDWAEQEISNNIEKYLDLSGDDWGDYD